MQHKYAKGICSCHGKERWLVNKAGMCEDGRRQSRKKKPRDRDKTRAFLVKRNNFKLKKKPLFKKPRKKPTGEIVVFKEIWEERPPWCEWCGKGILEFNVANYHHIKPKSKFPELRLIKENIVKICFECHFNHHNS